MGQAAWQQSHWQQELDGELIRYFALRHESVFRLWSEVYQAVHAVSSNVQVHLQDPSSIGVHELSAHDLAWLSGLEIPPRPGMADGVTLPGYIAEMADFQREVDLYTTRVLSHTALEVGLRPVPPDNQSEADFAAKVAYCAQRNVSGISFYNYGMLPPARFRWIREALENIR